MADFVLNLNNFIIQQLMKGDNSQINIHIEQSGGSLVGDLASGSTFLLYGITIMIMIFTGKFILNSEDYDKFKWNTKNTMIVIPTIMNTMYIILLTFSLMVFYIDPNDERNIIFGFVIIIFSIIIGCIIYRGNKKIKIPCRDWGVYYLTIYLVCIINNNYLKNELQIKYALIYILILVYGYLLLKSPKNNVLKEYIFYLTNQRCYSAKLETIKEGFLVLQDVELYNEENGNKDTTFEVNTIINKSNQKNILEKIMIIPKEQILSMYIVEKNEEESKKDKNQKIKKNSFILFLIIIIILIFFLGRFSNQYILKNNITTPILVSVILFSTGISLIKIKSSDYRREIEEFISKNKDSDYIDINEFIKVFLNITLNVIFIILLIVIKLSNIPKLLNLILFINFFNLIYLILEIKKFVIIFVKKIIDYIKLYKSIIKNSIIILLMILLFFIPLYISFIYD